MIRTKTSKAHAAPQNYYGFSRDMSPEEKRKLILSIPGVTVRSAPVKEDNLADLTAWHETGEYVTLDEAMPIFRTTAKRTLMLLEKYGVYGAKGAVRGKEKTLYKKEDVEHAAADYQLKTAPPPGYLSSAEVVKRYKVGLSTLSRYTSKIRNTRLTFPFTGGWCRYWFEPDVAAYFFRKW